MKSYYYNFTTRIRQAVFGWLVLGLLFTQSVVLAQPVLVRDINPGPASSNPASFADVNGTLFFTAHDGSRNGIWQSDGTESGTFSLISITASSLTGVNTTLFFVASDDSSGAELWKTNGRAASTVRVKDINPGPASSSPGNPGDLIGINGVLYFSAIDSTQGVNLWKSDGTEAGTVLVKDLPSAPDWFANLNGTLYFATNGSLWKSDGTEAGTVVVRSFAPTSYYVPTDLTASGGKLYFTTNDNVTVALWSSDGTEAGTRLEASWPRYAGGNSTQSLGSLRDVNGTLYFVRTEEGGSPANPNRYATLYKKDTGSAPVSLKSFSGSELYSFTNVNGALYFLTYGPAPGMWKSDGTPAGTVRVTGFTPLPNTFSALTAINGVLYFSAGDATRGEELWKYDPNPTEPTLTTLYVNTGGTAYNSTNGKAFRADAYFTGGNAAQTTGAVENTADDVLYLSERWGEFSYDLPVANGNYTVTLHFNEFYFGNLAPGGVGSRKFNVNVEGVRKLTEYDIFAKAGGAMRAISESFKVTVGDSALNIDFLKGLANFPKISAIEVIPADTSRLEGYYILTAKHSRKVLDVPAASRADWTQLIQYSPNSPLTDNQIWRIESVGEGYYKLTAKHSGKVLDVAGVSAEEGAPVIQYRANRPLGDNQQWRIESIGEGYYKLTAKHSGNVLQVAGASLANGALVEQGRYWGGFHQQWQLQPVGSATARRGYPISEVTATLTIYPNPAREQITVHLPFPASQVYRTAITDGAGNQHWVNRHQVVSPRQLSMPVQELKPGFYLLTLDTPTGRKVMKFVRQESR